MLEATEATDDFHARFSAVGKLYIYRILNSEQPDPILRHYVWRIGRYLDVDKMNCALSLLEGEHHFGAFQSAGSSARNPVRTLYSAHCVIVNNTIEFRFHGNGFLYHMVRNIVGSVVDVGTGKTSLEELQRIFSGADRRQAGPTAPPEGLYLKEVFYEKP